MTNANEEKNRDARNKAAFCNAFNSAEYFEARKIAKEIKDATFLNRADMAISEIYGGRLSRPYPLPTELFKGLAVNIDGDIYLIESFSGNDMSVFEASKNTEIALLIHEAEELFQWYYDDMNWTAQNIKQTAQRLNKCDMVKAYVDSLRAEFLNPTQPEPNADKKESAPMTIITITNTRTGQTATKTNETPKMYTVELENGTATRWLKTNCTTQYVEKTEIPEPTIEKTLTSLRAEGWEHTRDGVYVFPNTNLRFFISADEDCLCVYVEDEGPEHWQTRGFATVAWHTDNDYVVSFADSLKGLFGYRFKETKAPHNKEFEAAIAPIKEKYQPILEGWYDGMRVKTADAVEILEAHSTGSAILPTVSPAKTPANADIIKKIIDSGLYNTTYSDDFSCDFELKEGFRAQYDAIIFDTTIDCGCVQYEGSVFCCDYDSPHDGNFRPDEFMYIKLKPAMSGYNLRPAFNALYLMNRDRGKGAMPINEARFLASEKYQPILDNWHGGARVGTLDAMKMLDLRKRKLFYMDSDEVAGLRACNTIAPA